MSSAILRIQQATLVDVTDGESRNDGIPNQVVTFTSIGSGTTHELSVWDVYPVGTPRTLAHPSALVWTINPGAGYLKSYGVELVVDRGLATEVRCRRVFRIAGQVSGLCAMLFGEDADPTGSLDNAGAAVIAASDDNAGGSYRGFGPHLNAAIAKIELLSAGSGITYGLVGEMVAAGTTADAGVINKPMRIDARVALPAAGGDSSGTLIALVNTQARGLRTTTGPTTLAMGAVADGEYLRRSGTDIIGGPGGGGGGVPDRIFAVFVPAAVDSTNYTITARTGPDTTNTQIQINSGVGSSFNSIRDLLIAAFQAEGYTAAAGGAHNGCFTVRRTGVSFDLICTDTNLAICRLIVGKSLHFGSPRIADGLAAEPIGYAPSGTNAYETNSLATTFTDFYAANSANRISFDLLEGLRLMLGFTADELPDGVWSFEGGFGASSSIGGAQTLTVWRHPQGPASNATDSRYNTWIHSGANSNVANATSHGVTFETDPNGRIWLQKQTANTADAIQGFNWRARFIAEP
jgi:hypothetical protein